MKKDIELLLEKNGKTDSKHILNTCPNKTISDEILNEIENVGVTFERMTELSKKIDIFRYRTQITIHGIFSELQNNRIGSYKNLFQNKNKSIGVKWDAIDKEKKSFIYEKLWYFNFQTFHNSTEHYCSLRKYCKDAENMKNNYIELKAILDRIDQTLFFGFANIYKYSIYGSVYLELIVSINAVPEANKIKLLEQIAGCTIDEVEQAKVKHEEEANAKWEAHKRESQARFEEEEKKKNEFILNNPISGAEQVKKYDLQEGDITLDVSENRDDSLYWKFRIVQKIKRTLFEVPYNYETKEAKDSYLSHKIKFPYSGYVIKNISKIEKKEVEQPVSKVQKIKDMVNELKLVDYSEKAIAVIGNTKDYKDTLKSLGGRFNFNLSCGAGWIFPKSKSDELKRKLNLSL